MRHIRRTLIRYALIGALALSAINLTHGQDELSPNGAWQPHTIAGGQIQVQSPPAWQTGESAVFADGLNMISPDSTAQIDVGILQADPPYESERFFEQFCSTEQGFTEFRSIDTVVLPAGDEGCAVSGTFTTRSGVPAQMDAYWLRYEDGAALIGVIGAVSLESEETLRTYYLAIARQVANTLRVGADSSESTYRPVSSGDGRLSILIPPSWSVEEPINQQSLLVSESETGAIVSITVVDMGREIGIEALQEGLRTNYTNGGGTIVQSHLALLPAGDAFYIFGERTYNGIPNQQVQFAVMRGSQLIIVTATAPAEGFAEVAVTLLQIVDTLAVTGM